MNVISQSDGKSVDKTENISVHEGWMPQRGDKVTARTANGGLVVRRVWQIGERVVYLCTDRIYEELLRGRSLIPPIGFPWRDVFKLNCEASSIST